MDYDRGGKRGRSPNRRFMNRGYRRGNIRGNYYPWRPNWSHNNHYNSHYAYTPRPPKPPSPLPGTEEYRQRNIQQTSELIKKQLNIDGSLCNDVTVDFVEQTKTSEDVTEPKKEETSQSSVATDQKKPKNKKNQVEEEEIDVEEIYNKIIKHISNLSYSKKMHLINQSNSGYDIAIQQVQKQKQLELSKALRDMSQRPTLDTDEEVIQSIIPDIGIKLEDLPNDVIKELSKTLQVKFESDYEMNMDVEESTDPHVIDMTISPKSNTTEIVEKETEQEVNDGLIDNIFDFEYLNKTEIYEDTFVASKNEIVERTGDEEKESGFSIANIDVTKSYLDLPMSLEFSKKSVSGLIRVKTDLFESQIEEKPENVLVLDTPVFTGKLCPKNIEETDNKDENTSTDFITIKNINNENKNASPNPIPLEQENPKQNSKNLHVTKKSSKTNASNVPTPTEQSKSSPGPSNINNSTNQNDLNPSNKLTTDEIKSDSPLSTSSFERLLFSPLIRDVQTPPNQLLTNEQPKKWKSPGEKKMLPVQNNQSTISSMETTQQLSFGNEQKEITAEKKLEDKQPIEDKKDKNIPDDKNKFKKKKKQKNEKVKPVENENKQSKKSENKRSKTPETPNNLPVTSVTFKEMATMVNFDSKHKRKKKTNVEVQTNSDLNLLLNPKEVKEIATMTDSTKLITVSAQTPMKFFKKNYHSKSSQTSQTNCKTVEVQATERTKTASTQTDKEIDDYKKKNAELLSQLRLMQQIDEDIKELLIKKKSLYDNLEVLTKGESPKNYSNKKKKSRKHDKIERNDKSSDKTNKIEKFVGESSKTDHVKINEDENSLKLNETNQVNTNILPTNILETPDLMQTEQEIQDITMKIKHKTHKDLKEKERSQESPIQKEQQFKQSPTLITKDTDLGPLKEKPLKLSLRIEKDENNVKKYSLKRDRSSSKDKESKPSTSTEETEESIGNAPADKRYKISKDIEKLVYNDNKFLKRCCVKLKPLKSNEYVKDNSMENEYEKTLETLEESSRSPGIPKEVDSVRVGAISENVRDPSPHSSCSTPSNVTAKPKSKVIDKLEFKGLTGSIFALKVIDENLLAAGDNGILYIYNVVSQELIATIHLSTQALTCLHVTKVLNNNECLIYVGCLDGQLRVVNFANKELQQTVNIDRPIQCMDICWGIVFIGSTTGDLNIYNTKTSKLEDSIHIFDNRIYTIKAMQEGPRRVLLIGTKDTELSIRDAMTGLLMREFKTNFSPTIYSILAEHNLVFCGTNQHDVLAYSFQDGELIKRYEGIASRRVICMQLVNNLLFVGCFNGSVCVFHKSTHQYLGHMIRPGESLLSMIIVNNKVIVGLKNNKLVIWDVPEVYLEKNR